MKFLLRQDVRKHFQLYHLYIHHLHHHHLHSTYCHISSPPHPPAPPTPGNWNIEVPKRDSNGDFCVMNFSSNAVGDARSRYGALAPNQVRGFPVYHVPPYAINAPL